MKLAVVQLSDIHIRSKADPIFSRVTPLSRAIISLKAHADNFVIVCTGDITDKGQVGQFEAAFSFFDSLFELLKLEINVAGVLFTPGNHDCNLEYDDEARTSLKSTLKQDNLEILKGNSIFNILSQPHSDYFAFEKKLANNVQKLAGLYSNYDLHFGQYNVSFHSINTAYLYSKDENDGKILFPFSKIKPYLLQQSELSCALSHYPSNWFHPDAEASFRKNSEPYLDFIFTGHRHEPDNVVEIKASGSSNDYCRGGRLQYHRDNTESTFNVLIADLDIKQSAYVTYSWDKDHYRPLNNFEYKPYKRGILLSSDFVNNENFVSQLEDPGILYYHPEKGKLSLSDIFVPYEIELEANRKKKITISEEKTIDLILEKGKVYFTGGSGSGKTILTKTLYKRIHLKKIIPIVVNGRALRHLDAVNPLDLVKKRIEIEYSKGDFEKYIQLPKQERAIIFEDFDDCKISDSDKQQFLAFIDNNFEYSILTGTYLFELDELTSPYSQELSKYCRCSIAPCGHLMRGKIIKKWLSLDTNPIDPESYTYKLKSLEQLLNEILSKKMSMQPNPFVVFTLLQKLSSPEAQKPEQGSYGYLYQVIIDTALIKQFPSQEDLSVVHSFLAFVAHYLYINSYRAFTKEQLVQINQDFVSRYTVTISESDLNKIVDSGILVEEDDGFYFKHPYMFCFFIAQYLSLNAQVSKDEVQGILKHCCDNLLDNSNSSIIMFYAFQSNQDAYLIKLIIEKAKTIFAAEKEFDLSIDTRSLNKSITSIFKYFIPDKPEEEKREGYLKQQDEAEEDIQPPATPGELLIPLQFPLDKNAIEYSLRMINVLGQIVKNYPGSIRTPTKLELTNESYNTGLRTLTTLEHFFDQNSEIIKNHFIAYIENNMPTQLKKDSTPEQRAILFGAIVNNLLFIVATGYFLAVIKNISKPIGSPRLALLFAKVKDDRNNLSTDFIDVSIELDHYKSYPTNKIDKLCDVVCKDNPFAKNLLANLVVDNHMNYPPSRKLYRTVERIYTRLGIEFNPHQFANPKPKLALVSGK